MPTPFSILRFNNLKATSQEMFYPPPYKNLFPNPSPSIIRTKRVSFNKPKSPPPSYNHFDNLPDPVLIKLPAKSFELEPKPPDLDFQLSEFDSKPPDLALSGPDLHRYVPDLLAVTSETVVSRAELLGLSSFEELEEDLNNALTLLEPPNLVLKLGVRGKMEEESAEMGKMVTWSVVGVLLLVVPPSRVGHTKAGMKGVFSPTYLTGLDVGLPVGPNVLGSFSVCLVDVGLSVGLNVKGLLLVVGSVMDLEVTVRLKVSVMFSQVAPPKNRPPPRPPPPLSPPIWITYCLVRCFMVLVVVFLFYCVLGCLFRLLCLVVYCVVGSTFGYLVFVAEWYRLLDLPCCKTHWWSGAGESHLMFGHMLSRLFDSWYCMAFCHTLTHPCFIPTRLEPLALIVDPDTSGDLLIRPGTF